MQGTPTLRGPSGDLVKLPCNLGVMATASLFRNQLPEETTEGVAMRWRVEYLLWFAMERSVTAYNRMSEYVIVRHCPEAKITMMAPGSACSDTR